MRKSLYQITMKIFPVYFTALIIAIVIFAVFFGAQKVQAQTNKVDFNSMIAVVPLHGINEVQTSSHDEKIIVLDETRAKVEVFSNLQEQTIRINVNRTINTIFIFDNNNQLMEDMPVDYTSGQVDISGLCPGVYYIRIDYAGGSYLKRFVVTL
jgi:hypothetical protein